ncbi:MAG TPA: C69 family dipeptidase [Blastocatellia bacterium]|nr:C69 family dipeptidase [Blastocatellia bacterium]
MCDTMVAVPPATSDGAVWFGKNSDREPGEMQLVEHLPAQTHTAANVQCTYLAIPQNKHTFEVVLSRPFWMWGAEMGANERGVVIGNEAVFTKLPYAKEGLLGMDLLRLALERADCAREALQVITDLLGRHGQGGACGYRNKKFRYHNSFLIADANEAWVLETADKYWVAEQVKGIRTISNVLTIGKEFDLIAPDAYEFARTQGWCKSADDFDFARCFGDAKRSDLSGGAVRRACTMQRLSSNDKGVGREDVFATLRDHNGFTPKQGWRLQMPCTHASWWPTRRSGQTTGSMVSRVTTNGAQHYLTGTSSPCLSVYKPVMIGRDNHLGDTEALFWQHERLHRLVIGDYARRRAAFEEARVTFQVEALSRDDAWEAHREKIRDWTSRVERVARGRKFYSLFDQYWAEQNKLDQIFLRKVEEQPR